VDILPAFAKGNDINGLGRDLRCVHWFKRKTYPIEKLILYHLRYNFLKDLKRLVLIG